MDEYLAQLDAIRRSNLRVLARCRGGQAPLARDLGFTPPVLAQMLGPKARRRPTETFCRRVEGRLSLPFGWLDIPRASTQG